MHVGPYDTEPATIAALDKFVGEHGYALDFSDARHHHEIYLSNPQRCAPDRLRTVIRHPVRMASEERGCVLIRKEKGRCGGMNAAALVELMVIETTTSSMRTKRSTN